MFTAQLVSTLTCPLCGQGKTESMPTDACQYFYECAGCKTLLRPKAGDCCVFRGGPYLESRFFGEGVSIAVRKDDGALRRALDWALARVWVSGKYTEAYRKYFPISFY